MAIFLYESRAEFVTRINIPMNLIMKEASAHKKAVETTLHGDTRIDDYAWLRDAKWPEVKDDAILKYLKDENQSAEAFFKPLEELLEKLYQELRGRINEEDSSYSVREDGYLYYIRTEKGKDYVIHCRKKIDSKKEEILLNENELAKDQAYFGLGAFDLNHNHKLLAYSTDTTGQERYLIRIKDLQTGKFLEDKIENTAGGSVVWHKKLKGFFYVLLSDKWRADRVYYHTLGQPQSQDQLIYEEKDETFSVHIRYSADKRYIILDSDSSNTSEEHYIDLEADHLDVKIIFPRAEGRLYSANHIGGYFYILMNDTGSNFRLIKTPVEKFSFENWIELIPHNPSSYLANFALYKDRLAVKQVEEGLARIRVHPLNNFETVEEVPFKEAAYAANIRFTNIEDPFLRIQYSSLATPPTVFEYSFATKELLLRKTEIVLGGFNSSAYQVERLMAPSKDGTLVPISLVYKKSLKKQEGNPVFLYGYGSYGAGREPYFTRNAISLLDRGFIYAIGHIRGGDDLGWNWYEDGKLLKKWHTFEDFIACSEHLIAKGYTTKNNIAICGGSAGGMLMGVCANERPDLYRAVISMVPFVDVLNTMLDGDLPLTPGEYKEWGNPKEEAYYHYIKSYSPYENIKKQDYPHLYVTGGLNDPRVPYWEPAKWVAKLRDHKTDDNLLLFETKMGAGHFGPSGRFSYLKDEVARYYAFLLHVFGMDSFQ